MSNEILRRRRQELMSMMGDGVAIVTTAHHQSRNGDVYFKLRPDSDFYYLTRFPEPDAVRFLRQAVTRESMFCSVAKKTP